MSVKEVFKVCALFWAFLGLDTIVGDTMSWHAPCWCNIQTWRQNRKNVSRCSAENTGTVHLRRTISGCLGCYKFRWRWQGWRQCMWHHEWQDGSWSDDHGLYSRQTLAQLWQVLAWLRKNVGCCCIPLMSGTRKWGYPFLSCLNIELFSMQAICSIFHSNY